jgi:diguanylate cyclase (GGDEF)-like protein
MLWNRSHLRRLALLCLLLPIHFSLAAEPSAPSSGARVFEHPGNVTCRYRLEGLQNEFTETTLPETHYFSLPGGSYTFLVNCDSPRHGEIIAGADSFIVAASWWERWLPEIVGGGGLILLIWGMIWSRYRDRRASERLERAVAERSAELAKANRELEEASLCDPLTGIHNRRFFRSMITADASQVVRAYRGSESYSRDHRDLIFFLIDIDHFKKVNDEYGHDAGDQVLIQVAQRLKRVVRESDFLIRWGGEEFLLVFRAAERNDAEIIASRILKAINVGAFDLGNGRQLARSCSLGWAAFPWLPPAYSNLSVDEVLRLADRGLYIAKQQGRNRAVGLTPTTNTPTIGASTGDGTVLTKPEKYSCVEQLLESKLIREVPVLGEMAEAAAG